MTGLLAHWLQRQGRRVITVKMVQTGNDGFSEDLESHRAMMGGVSFPEDKADITVGTLSKALGGEGGFVCGRRLLCDYLRNRARGFIFTTAMSPVSAAVAREALRILQSSPELPVHLAENVRAFVAALCEHGVETQTQSAIVPIPIGDERRAVQVAAALHERGIFLSAIRYPTVARGQARLRAAVPHSFHGRRRPALPEGAHPQQLGTQHAGAHASSGASLG